MNAFAKEVVPKLIVWSVVIVVGHAVFSVWLGWW